VDANARERRKTAAAAGFDGDVAAVVASLTDPDHRVRAAGLRSSDRVGNLTTEVLASALADPHPHVRITALELAARRTEPPIGVLLGDTDDRVIEQAAWTCGERRHVPADTARLVELAGSHDDPLVREAAVAALGAIGHDDGLSAILTATTDKPAIRRRAVLALSAFDGSEVDEVWQRARHDRDRQVRDAVDELLGPETSLSTSADGNPE